MLLTGILTITAAFGCILVANHIAQQNREVVYAEEMSVNTATEDYTEDNDVIVTQKTVNARASEKKLPQVHAQEESVYTAYNR